MRTVQPYRYGVSILSYFKICLILNLELLLAQEVEQATFVLYRWADSVVA
eukprot:SAG31_NODE_30129_length_385_cov_0.709790_1_plen_49_part_10